jgi:hypothetical protein
MLRHDTVADSLDLHPEDCLSLFGGDPSWSTRWSSRSRLPPTRPNITHRLRRAGVGDVLRSFRIRCV